MVTVVAGLYGSGKTEFAINYAVQSGAGAIVDLDIVNPYFRTADVRKRLEGLGMRVVAPKFAGSNVDIPALPAEIYGVFQESQGAVFDVGGGDDGAVALGRFRGEFETAGYQMFYVVNARRPGSQSPAEIVEMVKLIEESSRLKVGGFVNNTNVMWETDPSVVEEGRVVVEEAARMCGVPVEYTTAFSGNMPEDVVGKSLVMSRYISLPWEKKI